MPKTSSNNWGFLILHEIAKKQTIMYINSPCKWAVFVCNSCILRFSKISSRIIFPKRYFTKKGELYEVIIKQLKSKSKVTGSGYWRENKKPYSPKGGSTKLPKRALRGQFWAHRHKNVLSRRKRKVEEA